MDDFEYASFEAAIDDLIRRYRLIHRGEVEGLDYEFHIVKTGERSGLIRADRLRSTDEAAPPGESLLIEDNRVVRSLVHPATPPGWWLS